MRKLLDAFKTNKHIAGGLWVLDHDNVEEARYAGCFCCEIELDTVGGEGSPDQRDAKIIRD